MKKKMMLKMPIGKKVIKDLLREKTIIFVILLQLFIILASSVILTNSNILFNPGALGSSVVGFGVYSYGNNSVSDDESMEVFIELLQEGHEDTVFVQRFSSKRDALEAFMEHEIDGLLGFNLSPSLSRDDPRFIDISLPKGDIKTSLATIIIKEKLTLYEDYLRHKKTRDQDIVRLTRVKMKNKASAASVSLFESLYQIVIPFLILLPGILLGGLIIDILFEDLETKTINLLMIITSFRKYLYEILLTILALSMLQVVLWEALLIIKGIYIAHLPLITSLTIFMNLILFLMAIIITLLYNEKTRAQITYSFIIILLFVSSPLSSYNPIRMITKLSIGLEQVPFYIYSGVLVAIIAILTGIITYISEKKEW